MPSQLREAPVAGASRARVGLYGVSRGSSSVDPPRRADEACSAAEPDACRPMAAVSPKFRLPPSRPTARQARNGRRGWLTGCGAATTSASSRARHVPSNFRKSRIKNPGICVYRGNSEARRAAGQNYGLRNRCEVPLRRRISLRCQSSETIADSNEYRRTWSDMSHSQTQHETVNIPGVLCAGAKIDLPNEQA